MTARTKTLYYVFFVPREARHGIMASKPLDELVTAGQHARELYESGEAAWSVVVRFCEGEREPLADTIWPRKDRLPVKHWEDVWDAVD